MNNYADLLKITKTLHAAEARVNKAQSARDAAPAGSSLESGPSESARWHEYCMARDCALQALSSELLSLGLYI